VGGIVAEVMTLPVATAATLSAVMTTTSVVWPVILALMYGISCAMSYKEYTQAAKKELSAKEEYEVAKTAYEQCSYTAYGNRRLCGYARDKEIHENEGLYENDGLSVDGVSVPDDEKKAWDKRKNLFLDVYAKEQTYLKYQQKTQNAKTKFIFSGIEFSTALIGVLGASLLCASLLGAASFGAAPVALLVVGASLAVIASVCEWVDEENNFKYSHKIRNKWNEWFGDGQKKEPTPTNTTHLQKLMKKSCEMQNFATTDVTKHKQSLEKLNESYYGLNNSAEKKLFRKAALKELQENMNFLKGKQGEANKIKVMQEAAKAPVFAESRHRWGLFRAKPSKTAIGMEESVKAMQDPTQARMRRRIIAK
jgi:hypothetical protein